MIKLIDSCVLNAFSLGRVVGTKVKYERGAELRDLIVKGISERRPNENGHFKFSLPPEATSMVTSGEGRHTHRPEDYVVAVNRGRVGLFLKRSLAAECQKVAVVVYTTAAYLADPEIELEEAARIRNSGATHVIVALLASTEAVPELTPYRFASNLAGGSRDWDPIHLSKRLASAEGEPMQDFQWGAEQAIRFLANEARNVVRHDDTWCVVADY